MKKIYVLFLLLFIPIVSHSQTFDDLKLIDNLNDFKRVMIENNYQFDGEDDTGNLYYGYNLVKGSITTESKSDKWGIFLKDGGWVLQLRLKDFNTIVDSYEEIKKTIMKVCVYYDIITENGDDYVAYSCDSSKLGFRIGGDFGYIRHFPSR